MNRPVQVLPPTDCRIYWSPVYTTVSVALTRDRPWSGDLDLRLCTLSSVPGDRDNESENDGEAILPFNTCLLWTEAMTSGEDPNFSNI